MGKKSRRNLLQSRNVAGARQDTRLNHLSTELCGACRGPVGETPIRCDQCEAVRYCDSRCRQLHRTSHQQFCGMVNKKCPICEESPPVEAVSMCFCPHRICKACLGRELMIRKRDKCPVCDHGAFSYQCQGTNAKYAIALECSMKVGLFNKSDSESDNAKYERLREEQVQLLREVIEEGQEIFPPGAASCSLGCALTEMGKLEHAGIALRQALEKYPNDIKALYTLGYVRLLAYNPAAAIAPLLRAVELSDMEYGDPHNRANLDASDMNRLNDYRRMLEHARNGDWPTKPQLRFKVGDKVEALVDGGFKTGEVEETWYREEHWPAERPPAFYQIWIPGYQPIDLVYANLDNDKLVRAAPTTKEIRMGLPGAVQVTLRSPRPIDASVETWSLPAYGLQMKSPSVGWVTGKDLVVIRSRIAEALNIKDGENVEFTFNETGDKFAFQVKVKDDISSDIIMNGLENLGLTEGSYSANSNGTTVKFKSSGRELTLGMQHMWAGMGVVHIQGSACLFFDGASRKNPQGPAGYGFHILRDGSTRKGDKLIEGYCYAGMNRSSNEMEYEALIEGLIWATRLNLNSLTVCGDSELIINQVTGKNSTNNDRLKVLHTKVKKMLERYGQELEIIFKHIPREENKIADILANQAIDTKKNVINLNWSNVNNLMGGE
jgi:ribonuclease HI